MKKYLDLLRHIRWNGTDKPDRTGTGMREIFGAQIRHDLSEGFPLLTTKKMFTKGIIHELLWFLNGDTNIEYLKKHDVNIWNEWADEFGDLGPIYGQQWRRWEVTRMIHEDEDGARYHTGHIDQIANVIDMIKTDPSSRRMVVTAWNPSDLKSMALFPCHCLFQFSVRPTPLPKNTSLIALAPVAKRFRSKLDCQLYQRSADFFIGTPFNIASYALLTMMIAQVCDLEPGDFIHTFGSAHLYKNHFEQADEQLHRVPLALPTMNINPKIKNIDEFTFGDFELVDYKHRSAIRAPIAV